ncbi:unnamed protein product, partial [Musa textilis]
MSHLGFEKANSFLRSSDHDIFAMHIFVFEASEQLEASLLCLRTLCSSWHQFQCQEYFYLISSMSVLMVALGGTGELKDTSRSFCFLATTTTMTTMRI